VIPKQSSQQLDDTKVTPQPSTSSNSPSPPSCSLDKAIKAKNQVTKKEKKGKEKKEKKKKEPKVKRGKQASSSENPHTAPYKPKYPRVIFKGNHYHRYCPCIPRILRDWSPHLHNPVSSTSEDHVESTPSTSESEAFGQKRKCKFPCKLCEGDHAIHCCPFLGEAKRLLDDSPALPLWLPPGYKKLLPSPSLVEKLTDTPLWLVEAPAIEDKPAESIPDESQKVEVAVDPILPSEGPSLDDTITEENENNTVQIPFINRDSDEHGGSLPVPLPQDGSSSESYPTLYLVPPPSNLVDSLDWNLLGRPHVPANVPFRIITQAYKMIMVDTVIDEGASMSILSLISLEELGSPSLLPEMRNLTGFHKGTSQLLGILLSVPITLRRKIVYVNVMVVRGPLDYNLLLGRDYIYSMGAIVSSLFRVMCFLHEDQVVKLVDQLSFPDSHIDNSQMPSLNGLFMQGMSHQSPVRPPGERE